MVVAAEDIELYQDQDELLLGSSLATKRSSQGVILWFAGTDKWVHKLLSARSEFEAYNTLMKELSVDGEKFQEFFQLNSTQFAQVLSCVEEDLVKVNQVRDVICPRHLYSVRPS